MRFVRRASVRLALGSVLAGCGLTLTGEIDGTIAPDAGDAPSTTTIPVEQDAAIDAADARRTIDSGPPPRSCLEIKQRAPSTVSGKRTITIPGRGEVTVHCEMQLLGGGFTLVARANSSGSSAVPFGWTSATGTLDGDGPYSLDARGLEFTRILLAEWKTGGPPTLGVLFNAPPNFLSAYANTSIDLRTMPNQSVDILGGCTNADFNMAGQMVRHIGHTSNTTHFYIRDLSTPENFGLLPNRFNLAGNGCGRSMDLDDKRGAIWVR